MEKKYTSDVPVKLSAAGRFSAATKRIWSRIFRKPAAGMPPIWTQDISNLALVAAVAVAIVAPLDPVLAEMFGRSLWAPIVFLRSVTDAVKSHFYLIPAFAIMLLVTLLNLENYNIRQRQVALKAYGRSAFIFFAIALPGIGINIIKQFIGRGRPSTLEEFGPYVFHPFEFTHTFQGFPSGHSTTAGAIAMILVLWYPRWRWLIWPLGMVLASARIAANAHYLSDVVAGYSIGILATVAIARYLAARNLVFRSVSASLLPILRR